MSWRDQLEFLQPVSETLFQELGIYSIGQRIKTHVGDSATKSIALLMLNPHGRPDAFHALRKSLYAMQWGGWDFDLIDLGDLIPAEEASDTLFLLKQIAQGLLSQNTVLCLIGGDDYWAYHLYRAFDHFEHPVNYVGLDYKLALNNDDSLLGSDNFLSHIIRNPPNNLLSYTHLAHQAFYTAPEELDLLDAIHFDAKNLGELVADLHEAEPMLRTADLAQISLNTLQSSDFAGQTQAKPNGLNSREICTLSRYMGIAAKLRALYISNYNLASAQASDHELLAQIVWYFLAGYHFRPSLHDFSDLDLFDKIHVPQDTHNLVFYRNRQTQQWWLEATLNENIEDDRVVVPASEKDYKTALLGELPERFWKTYKRFF